MNDLIREKLKLLPESSGCYLMKDKNGKLYMLVKLRFLKEEFLVILEVHIMLKLRF